MPICHPCYLIDSCQSLLTQRRSMLWEWFKLPNIPQISQLPKEISKSLLDYLLRWTVGKYIDIDNALAEDGIDIYNRRLNTTSINSHLTSFPIETNSASLGRLSIQVPWSNLFNDPINVVIEDLHITFQPSTRSDTTDEPGITVDDLTEQYIENQDIVIPGSFDAPPAAVIDAESPSNQRTLLKSLINAILAKLRVNLKYTSIKFTEGVSDNGFDLRIGSLDYGDVDLDTQERKLKIDDIEIHSCGAPPDQSSQSQMFMSAQESLTLQTQQSQCILKLIDGITMKLCNNSLPTIEADFGRTLAVLYPSTISLILTLIEAFPPKTESSSNGADSVDSNDMFNLKASLKELRVLLLLDEVNQVINESDLWNGGDEAQIPGYFLDLNATNVNIKCTPECSLSVGDASILANDSVSTSPILVFDEAIAQVINEEFPRMSDWLAEDDGVNMFDHKSWKLLDRQTSQSEPPAVTMTRNDVKLSPVHFFVDLGIIERFFGSDLFKALDFTTKDHRHDSVVNSLLTEAEKQNDPSLSEVLTPLQKVPFLLTVSALRISVRCPPPLGQQSLRSGILAIDARCLKLTPNSTSTDVSVEWSNVNWLDARHIREKMQSIARIRESRFTIEKRKRQSPKLTFNVPFIELKFRKREVIGLQYLADDFAQFSERLKLSASGTSKKEDVMQSVVELVKSRLIVADETSTSAYIDDLMDDFFSAEASTHKDAASSLVDDTDIDINLEAGTYTIDVPTVNLNTGEETGDYATIVADARAVTLSAKFGNKSTKVWTHFQKVKGC
ncbi:hypothetical protein E3Q22_01768 [Wallemia mellicola]|uniref:Autophagy-related protein 2 n=1 Tax=Wallemia mellicola TaxID=1708541 RepID=A0A4T0MC65_9BASI|nr:hypothetical protein E3Q22_01768 [Wallemia mellicola]